MKSITLLFLLSILFFQKTNAQNLNEAPFDLQEHLKGQKRNLLKTSITSPLLGNFSFSLEHALQPRRTLEVRFSFIHSNKVSSESVDGFYTGFGYKFFTSSIHSSKNKRATPILQGVYIQPELLLGFINKNKFLKSGISRNLSLEKEKTNYQVLLSNFGLQVKLRHSLFLDVFVGIGIGRDNLRDTSSFFFDNSSEIYHQGILKADTGFSMAGKAGIRLGVLL